MFELLAQWFLANGVRYMLYIVLILITLVTVKDIMQIPIKSKFTQIRYRARLRRKRANEKLNRATDSGIFRHLYFLVRTTSKGNKEQDVLTFIFISSFLVIMTFVILFLNISDVILSLFVALVVGIIPYLTLQVRLKNIRNKVGNDLTPVVGEMTQQYNANHYDMYRTLIETTNHLNNNVLKRVFVRLISDLQTAATDEEKRMSIDLFIFTCGNSWSKRLGNIILKGYYYDENVMNALLALNKQMGETEKMLEEEKSFSVDPVVNGLITVPVFVSAIFLGHYVTGPQDWLNLQFNQSWSLVTFVLALSLTIISVFISLLLRNPKNDL